MNEKNTIKVSLGTVFCMFIIFILILVLIGMYVYYNYTPRENVNNSNDREQNNTNITTNEPTITSLDIDSKLIKKLYNYILKFNYYDEILVYQADKVTSDNIDNQLKLLTAFENLDESQAEKVKSTDSMGTVEDDGNSYKYLYTKETVEQKIKEIFGEKASVTHENCSPYDGYSRIYENGIYTCYNYEGGGDVPWSTSKNQLIKAETDGNDIYIYDSYMHIVETDNTELGTYYDIYATSDRNILIEENINLEKEGIYDGWDDDVPFEEFEETYVKNLFNIIENKQKTFKHTFSKDTNGNYYWVSTEIVD